MTCPSTQVYHDQAFIDEIWAWFAVGTFALVARFIVRLRTVGWRRLQGDDYMAIVVWLFFICDTVTVTLLYYMGTNVDFTPDEIADMQQCQIDRIRLGSELQFVGWYSYTGLIWGLKAMVLFFFNRLTFGLKQQRLVKIYAVACGLTYAAVFITVSASCHPIEMNWQVRPLPPKRCTMKLQNIYVTTACNVATDAAILTISLPLLWQMRMSIVRKIFLTLLLGSGIFVITAAVVRLVFTMTSVNALNLNTWGTRETIAGILAVNAPILKPLFCRSFWPNYKRSSSHSYDPELGLVGDSPRTIGSRPTPRRRYGAGDMFGVLRSLSTNDEKSKGSETTIAREVSEDGSTFVSLASHMGPAIAPARSPMTGNIHLPDHDSPTVMSPGTIHVSTTFDVTRDTPQPLLPEPAMMWPSEGRPPVGMLARIQEADMAFGYEANTQGEHDRKAPRG